MWSYFTSHTCSILSGSHERSLPALQRLPPPGIRVVISAAAHFGMVFGFHFASRVFPPPNPNDVATLPEHMVICPIGFIVQATGSYFLALMYFAAAGIALLICSSLIDYSRKLPV